MKYTLPLFCIVNFFMTFAQESDQIAVRETVETFFDGFHKQDSAIIKQAVRSSVILQTIAKGNKGETYIRKDNFHDFLKSIVGIPETTKFKEKITSYTIQVDGALAHAWAPYEFWINGEFHHCGVNSFQLFKDSGIWKIIYLVDTRRKEGCE